MKLIFLSALLLSCGGFEEQIETIEFDNTNSFRLQCLGMKNLWQIECFCYQDESLCEGRKYPCFWDISRRFGLSDHLEMTDLYEIFYQDRLNCRDGYEGDVDLCDGAALEKAIKRCEERLIGEI